MTIRRHVNIAELNEDFMAFEEACSEAPQGMFQQARAVRDQVLGYSADEFLRVARSADIEVCNSDGIREIETMMFDMLRRMNPGSEIDMAIYLGRALRLAPDDRMALYGSKQDIIARLKRDRDFLASFLPPIDDEPVVNDDEDQYAGSDAPFPGQEA